MRLSLMKQKTIGDKDNWERALNQPLTLVTGVKYRKLDSFQ